MVENNKNPQSDSDKNRDQITELVEGAEMGDEALVRRIKSTLDIDSATHPTLDQIREFVALQSSDTPDVDREQ